MAEGESHEKVTDFDIKESTKERLVMTKYPFIEWSVAFAFLLAFSFCEFMICIVNKENNRYTLHHSWVQMVLLSVLLLGGLFSLYEGEVESIILDKKAETILVRYVNFICKKRYHCHALKNINCVRACVRGHKGHSETVHYVLCIFMHSGEMIKVLFSKSEQRIKKQLLAIRKFLAIELDKPIAVVDMSTAEYEVKKDLKERILEVYRKAKQP